MPLQCCGYLLESPCGGDSNRDSQHIILFYGELTVIKAKSIILSFMICKLNEYRDVHIILKGDGKD